MSQICDVLFNNQKLKTMCTDGINKIKYEIESKKCDSICEEIQKFISTKYKNYDYNLSTMVFDTLLESHYDHQATAWRLKDVSTDLLAALSKSGMQEAMGSDLISNSVNLLKRIIEFADTIQGEKEKAELDYIVVKEYGTDNFKVSLHLEKEYRIKTKLAIYENQLESELA